MYSLIKKKVIIIKNEYFILILINIFLFNKTHYDSSEDACLWNFWLKIHASIFGRFRTRLSGRHRLQTTYYNIPL